MEEYGAVGQPDKVRAPSDWKPSGYDEYVAQWYVSRVLAVTPSHYALVVEAAFAHEFPRFKLTGHQDCYAIAPDQTIAIINDLKRGFGLVDHAEENVQLMCYTALLKLAFPPLEKVLLRIHQPAAPDKTTEFVAEKLDTLVAYVDAAFNETLDDPYTLNTGKWCNYCPALLVCPAARKEIFDMQLKLTKEEYDRIQGVATTEELAALVARARKITYPIERLTETLKARLAARAGEVIRFDGGSVFAAEGLGNRQISDRDFAFRKLSDRIGAVNAIKAFKPSLTEIEAQLAEHTGMKKTSKKEGVQTCATWVNENLGAVITREKVTELHWEEAS